MKAGIFLTKSYLTSAQSMNDIFCHTVSTISKSTEKLNIEVQHGKSGSDRVFKPDLLLFFSSALLKFFYENYYNILK